MRLRRNENGQFYKYFFGDFDLYLFITIIHRYLKALDAQQHLYLSLFPICNGNETMLINEGINR